MNHTLKYFLFIFLVICCIHDGNCQLSGNIRDRLINSGFENVRVLQEEGKYYISIENHIYRWDVEAIHKSLDLVAAEITIPSEINLVLLKNSIPDLLFIVTAENWENFKNGILTPEQFSDKLAVTYRTDGVWEKIKNSANGNTSSGKADIVFYPQFAFENTRFDQMYEVQLNIAPALEISIWRGLKFTGQVIFPIVNELRLEGNYIRPGFLVLSKGYRFPGQWLGKVSMGNFDGNRYGFDIFVRHPFRNENWNIQMNAGLTGSSHFLKGQWIHSKPETFTWSALISFFYPRFNLELKGGAGQYIYHDVGLFGECTRFFGETAIGFYAQLGEHNLNGGFRVTVPFPVKKRNSRKIVRISLPEHYRLTYDAGTEFYYGQNYYSNPLGNEINNYNFSKLFKGDLINLITDDYGK